MNQREKRLTLWLVAAVIVLTLLPGTAQAEGLFLFQPLSCREELVTGRYVLLSPDGFAPGPLQNGFLPPVQPLFEGDSLTDAAGALWLLEVTEDGVLLTDPAGTTIAPGDSAEAGLVPGEYFWSVTCTDGLFSFHGTAQDTDVTLARCADLGFCPCAAPLPENVCVSSFALYRMPEIQDVPSSPAEETAASQGPRLYFGQLHAHTRDSDGTGTPADAYDYAAHMAGLDFFAVTDHSNSLEGGENSVLSEDASQISEIWRLGREAAKNATTDSFLALYGFEMSWQNGLGHINTFFTPGFQSRKQAEFAAPATALDAYFAALNTVPGAVSQFNHPGTFYGDFEDFGHYSAEADAVMQLLEVCSEGVRSYDAYTRALDKGWHVAPTNNQNNHAGHWGDADSGRTVVYADALTEDAFAAALQNRRVYATEDSDLEILFTLNGSLFGSVLPARNVGEQVVLTASLHDPTDEAIGTVEVVVDGGTVAAAQELPGSTAEISFELPAVYHYYYLRLTQADGDVAVTAPVWLEHRREAEITAFTVDTALAAQNRPISLQVRVQNRSAAEFAVERVVFFIDGQEIGSVSGPASIPGNSEAVYEASLTWAAAGQTEIQVIVSGTIGDIPTECTASLNLTFLTEDLVTTIVADGSHSPLPELTELEAMAARHRMALATVRELTPEILSSCDLLLIPPPQQDYTQDYVNLISDFLRSGRTLILCGQADREDPDCTARLNSLAQALDLTARFRDDTAYDPVNNGGASYQLFTTVYNECDPLVSGIREPYSHAGGCTIDPGLGVWLVKGMPTTFSIDGDQDGEPPLEQTYTEVVDGFDVTHSMVTLPGNAVLLAREDTAFGGSVYLAGSLFPGDELLDPGGSNLWDVPNGNGCLLKAILQIPRETPPLSTIAQARAAGDGETVRVQGYVTAGTAVEANRFPNMLYVQDETGGLGVTDFTAPGVSLGTPVELYLLREGNAFRLLHWEMLEGASYHCQPKTPDFTDAVNDSLYTDQLVQAEGKVAARTLTADGKGVSAFTLEDREGNQVTVRIEDCIRSASTGENTLAEIVKEGSWVSAIGIVYRCGGQTVLRVRNCDEVTAVRETGRTYQVVKGEYSVWIRGDGGSVYMEVEGPGKELLGIEVDGVRISRSDYQTTEPENLTFRFLPRYLKTLELGTHSVVFQFRDGAAKATLVVWNYADNPYTGDPILLHLGMAALSGGLLAANRRRKQQR